MLRHVYDGKMYGSEKEYEWDELYMFFTSVEDALRAIVTRDFAAGRSAF